MAGFGWRDAEGRPRRAEPAEGPLTVTDDDRSIWRYRSAIPVDDASIVSRGEGDTPLIRGPEGFQLKCEYVSPSGSFKDRGASALVSGLLEAGVEGFFLDSSGNAGAAMAMYGSAVGMACEVLVPAAAPAAKTRQAEAYGAKITRVDGNREAVAEVARGRADTEVYASHNWQPLFIHGTKTVAYELWEQTDGRAIDHLVLPVGYGSLLVGCHLGFTELTRAASIDRLPRLHAVQAAASDPLVRALDAGLDEVPPIDPEPTLATAIATSAPVRGTEMLAAVRETGGSAVAVSEADIGAFQAMLASAGFFVEPSSAVAFAGAVELRERGVIQPDELTVVVLTGTGLKT